MVENHEWEDIAKGLVDCGLCEIRPRDQLYHVHSQVLHNGMFAVSKQEFIGDVEILRLIMNLKPLNSLCHGLTADTGTLPSITSMSGYYLQDEELLCLSSQDVRCFFYLFQVPGDWIPFLSFGKAVPSSMLDESYGDNDGFLCAKVLPMGFANSVGIAQHIHRNIIKKSLGKYPHGIGGESEIRRDRPQPQGRDLFRIYLDNFDELKKVDKSLSQCIEGQVSEVVHGVREAYEETGLPRHPKKSVVQQFRGEVRGAWVDGVQGTVMAKPGKIARYVGLALEIIKTCKASQRELQVVGGGLVYASMFRRPALCGLNHLWRAIVQLERKSVGSRVKLKREVILELARFITLLPLLFINFRAPFDELVTASDASTSGGGICVSKGLTPYGTLAAQGLVRGEIPEDPHRIQVLSIGLFDGISALRVALDGLHVPVMGHVSVEMQEEARRVVESYFPDSLFVDNVEKVDEVMVQSWALLFGSVGLVLLGSGPPCQGVSGLNADRRGALRDHRSKLYFHVPRIVLLVKKFFPWCQVHYLTENVASMDKSDCEAMCESFEDKPWLLDAEGISIAHRPRLYWVSWEMPTSCEGVTVLRDVEHQLPIHGQVFLKGEVDEKDFLEAGWKRMNGQMLPTFTTSRPSEKPMRKPAGFKLCQQHELARWRADQHRFPPYQYRDIYCVHKKHEEARPPSVLERDVILGFPPNYTKQCMSKQYHDSQAHQDCRLTPLGNSWSVPVIAWLVKGLLEPLGIVEPIGLQTLLERFTPGRSPTLQGMLLRPPLSSSTRTDGLTAVLPQKLFGLTSLKGEDLLVRGDSEPPLRYHRLRMSVPAKLWRWRTVTGWKWRNNDEHINTLELRAVYTSIKWRVEQLQQQQVRCVHLVDSLVSLHSLSRGRSSSRKLMRTVMKINSLLLVSGLHTLWGYVDTKQNPADRPSRWGGSRRWVRKKHK